MKSQIWFNQFLSLKNKLVKEIQIPRVDVVSIESNSSLDEAMDDVTDFIDTELANYCSSNKYIKDKVGDGPKKIT